VKFHTKVKAMNVSKYLSLLQLVFTYEVINLFLIYKYKYFIYLYFLAFLQVVSSWHCYNLYSHINDSYTCLISHSNTYDIILFLNIKLQSVFFPLDWNCMITSPLCLPLSLKCNHHMPLLATAMVVCALVARRSSWKRRVSEN
jgi:hypothetical protein